MHLEWLQIVELLTFVLVLCIGWLAGWLMGSAQRRRS